MNGNSYYNNIPRASSNSISATQILQNNVNTNNTNNNGRQSSSSSSSASKMQSAASLSYHSKKQQQQHVPPPQSKQSGSSKEQMMRSSQHSEEIDQEDDDDDDDEEVSNVSLSPRLSNHMINSSNNTKLPQINTKVAVNTNDNTNTKEIERPIVNNNERRAESMATVDSDLSDTEERFVHQIIDNDDEDTNYHASSNSTAYANASAASELIDWLGQFVYGACCGLETSMPHCYNTNNNYKKNGNSNQQQSKKNKNSYNNKK